MTTTTGPDTRQALEPAALTATQERQRTRNKALKQLREMQEHHVGRAGTRGGRLRAAIFGVNDGLVSNASLVVGVAAADTDRPLIILAGIAGLVAGAFSMAAGEYISVKIQREVFEAQIELERRELAEDPAHERHEVSVIFQAKGVPRDDAERLADHVMQDPEVALDLMAREELGLNPDDLGSPTGTASSSFVSFALGAILPILPYVFLSGSSALTLALVLSASALFAVGVLTGRLTDRPALVGGLRMFLVGTVAMGVTYAIGRLVGLTVR